MVGNVCSADFGIKWINDLSGQVTLSTVIYALVTFSVFHLSHAFMYHFLDLKTDLRSQHNSASSGSVYA